MHTTQSILYIMYSTHYYVIILQHGSLHKFWASETCKSQENQLKLNLIILVNQMFYRGIHMFTTYSHFLKGYQNNNLPDV